MIATSDPVLLARIQFAHFSWVAVCFWRVIWGWESVYGLGWFHLKCPFGRPQLRRNPSRFLLWGPPWCFRWYSVMWHTVIVCFEARRLMKPFTKKAKPMAVVRRTLLGRAISNVCTVHSRSLGGIYPLKRIWTPQKIASLKVLNRKYFHDSFWPVLHLS